MPPRLLQQRYRQRFTKQKRKKKEEFFLDMCRTEALKEQSRALQSIQDTRLRTKLLSSRDSEGRTSLHIASMKGHKKVVDMLLRENADPRLVDFKGRTAFALAQVNPLSEHFKLTKMNNPRYGTAGAIRVSPSTLLLMQASAGERKRRRKRNEQSCGKS